MTRYIPSEDVLKRKYNKVVEANIKLVDENRYLKVDVEQLNQQLIDEKNAYNRMYNTYFKKEQEVERLNNVINELLKFIEDMFDEEVISNTFNLTTKEFIEYIKSKLKGSDKE